MKFNPKFMKSEPSDLEVEIARLLKIMKDMPPAGNEYAAVSEQYAKLTKLHHENTSRKRVSPDALAAAGTNLVTLLLVLHYEQAHVIGTKALGFAVKNLKIN